MRYRNIGWLLMICMLFVVVLPAHAAEPKVMVKDYEISSGKVVSGSPFELCITLENTAKRTVKNMKVTVQSENGELLPEKGAGNAYLEQIAAQEEQTLTFSMEAASGLEEKSYKLTVTMSYEDVNGNTYSVQDILYIPVGLEQRLSITDLLVDGKYVLGEELEITARINNLGDGALYNVAVQVSGDNLSGQESYIGQIEAGKSGNVDVLVPTEHVSDGTQRQNYLTVTYEDAKGEKKEETLLIQDLTQNEITAPLYENLEKVKDEPEKQSIGKVIGAVAGIVVVIVLIGYGIWKRNRRKEQILEEFT